MTAAPLRHLRPAPGAQRGIVLIIGLVFMVALTLIVLGVIGSGVLEERMAANARNRQIALQAAEAVRRDAEEWVRVTAESGSMPAPTADCANGVCTVDTAAAPRWRTIDWTSTTNTRSFASANSNLSTSLVASQPRYIVERERDPGYPPLNGYCKFRYQITARGVGLDGSEVFVQSRYEPGRPTPC